MRGPAAVVPQVWRRAGQRWTVAGIHGQAAKKFGARGPPTMRRPNLRARDQEVRISEWQMLVKHYYENLVNRSNERKNHLRVRSLDL